MTKEQWYDFAVKEWDRFDQEATFPYNVDDWPTQKSIILKHIKNLDELTQLYN